MPKGTIEVKKGDRRIRQRVRTKFKLGNRKSTKGAHDVPTDELVKLYTNGTPRDRATIRQVLHTRGVDLDTEVAEAA